MSLITKEYTLEPQNREAWIAKALAWANSFSHFSYLNPSETKSLYGGFPHLLAVGSQSAIDNRQTYIFDSLKAIYDQNSGWLFGYLSYDLKNEVEDLSSQNPHHTHFKKASFFQADHVIHFSDQSIKIESEYPDLVFQQIIEAEAIQETNYQLNIKQRTSKESYLQNVEKIKNHILEGDIYELNYCLEFYADQVEIDAIGVYLSLNQIAPAPFSVLMKQDHEFLICASPERFLKKEGNKLISQPIKGTAKRDVNPVIDNQNKASLLANEKERAENLMIVDLVRNDLARTAKTGSVKVEELFGIYSFSHVHQMISTVSSELKPENNPIDALKMAFPMGSMTGAPKIKSMELIEQYEDFQRGLYSGTFGYINPQGDFDFNVVIRSILYNSASKKLSFSVGSAITYDSDAEAEYQECLLKSNHIRQILG